MSLAAGMRLGAYEILAPLGAGAMGEVYSARDTRLERHVAIKLVLEAFVADDERTARFAQEARTLASLNHPNIAALHGMEEVDGRHFLVMELVQGETLAERIAAHAGGLPMQDALPIARQIAEALEAAHEKGIVHRDLKPANVKVTPGDTVKVLDFGLAKAMSTVAAGSGVEAMSSPTFTGPARRQGFGEAGTELGIVLGTAAYMAPEQARGKPVDKRADIWAFGVLLFEMLTGARLFAGDTVSDTIAAVLTREPDFELLPPSVPPHVRQLLRRCLERDPRRRLRDIGDARIELEQPATGVAPVPPQAVTSGGGRPATWIAMALAVALSVALAAIWQMRTNEGLPPVIQYEIPPPPGTTLQLSSRPAVAVSADGSMLVFAASSGGDSRLFLRRRGEVERREIPGTRGASDPAFSPDGRSIAFVTPSSLVKVGVDDGMAVSLAPVLDPRGLAWIDDQTIVATRSIGTGLSVIPAGGGTPVELTRIDREAGERSHRWPAVVAGGKAVLFTVGTDASPDDYNEARIDAVLLATGERTKVLDAAAMVRATGDGRLLFVRHGVLYVVGFDAARLEITGDPAAVLTGIEGDATTGAGHFSISAERTLVYVPGLTASGQRRLAWTDRAGTQTPIEVAPAVFNEPAISPDGTRFAVVVGTGGRADVWLYDLERQLFSRLTVEGRAAAPCWSPDGQSVYYTVLDTAAHQSSLMRKRVDGSSEAVALTTIPGRAYLGQQQSCLLRRS